MENKQSVVGLVLVGLLVAIAAGVIGYGLGKEQNMDVVTNTSDHSAMTMDEMTDGLFGLKGDAFDQAFVEMMIVHHQGAVDMAKLIPAQAKHDELKQLGEEIVTAQTKEIMMMKQWLKDWGYDGQSETSGEMMDHTMPGMQH